MTEHPDFNLDDAISADLDGELAAYAADLGIDVPTLRAQMAARREHPDRLIAMELARQSLRAPVEPLDDVTRARLLRSLSTEANHTSGRATSGGPFGRERIWRVLGAAAAVVLVIVGGLALLPLGGSSSSKQSKSATSGAAPVRSGQLGDLGSLDAAKLNALIGGGTDATATRNTKSRSGAAASTPEASNTVSGSDSQRTVADSAQTKPAADATVTPEQVGACQAEYAKVGTVRFSGTGVYQGRAAVVLGVESGGRTIVFVVANTDCSEVLVAASR